MTSETHRRPRCIRSESIVALQIRQQAPEVLIIAPAGPDFQEARSMARTLAALPAWWSLPAVRSTRVFLCKSDILSNPGPR